MSDQAEALRDLVDRRPLALDDQANQPEIWALVGGTSGEGVGTIAENMALALRNLGRAARVWDYRHVEFGNDHCQLHSGEIVLALLADQAGARSIWNTATHTLLVSQLLPRSVMATYARLEQLGAPQQSSRLSLLFNDVVKADDAARLHFNFDQSTRKFMQTRTVLAGIVPREPTSSQQFPPGSAAALAVRTLVRNLLQRNSETTSVSGKALAAGALL